MIANVNDKVEEPPSKPKGFEKYGALWSTENPIKIEIACIRNGGTWKGSQGQECGLGLFHHYKALQSLLWPDKRWHKWNDLLLENFISKRIIGVSGGASSGKTFETACYILCVYTCFPNETTVMVTSTDIRSLNLRVWGEFKKLWHKAKQRFPAMPGFMVESKNMLTTDSRESEIRDIRNGCIGIPCVNSSGSYVGIGKFLGVKNKRIILAADEASLMAPSFFDSISNLNKNQGFQCIAMGNPKDRTDPLGLICEPSDEFGGWEALDDEEKTRTWPTRFNDGIAIQLVGTDSPNFDVPEGEKEPYPFLIGRQAIATDLAFYGRDSLQFSMQNLGMFPKGSSSRRVVTRAICDKFNARDEVVWNSSNIVKVAGLDAAYSSVGGDRCVFTEGNFGLDIRGKMTFSMKPPIIVPITGKTGEPPEDQIARFVMAECLSRGIAPENLFYDSTGRGTLGTAFARIWSAQVNPVEFGGKPSDRNVSRGTSVTCRDYYSKFVSEIWYSVRHTIESDQMRGLTEEVMNELTMREWTIVSGNKIEVEPKEKTKKRMGRSPDLADSLCLALSGARSRGFEIERFETQNTRNDRFKWLEELKSKQKDIRKRYHLTA